MEGEDVLLSSLAAPPRLLGGDKPEAVATDGLSSILPRLRLGALGALGWLVGTVFMSRYGNRRGKPSMGRKNHLTRWPD